MVEHAHIKCGNPARAGIVLVLLLALNQFQSNPLCCCGFGCRGSFVQDNICARPAARVLPALLADPAQHLWQKRVSCGPFGEDVQSRDFCSLPAHGSSCSLAVSKMHQQLRMIFFKVGLLWNCWEEETLK